MKLSRPAAVFAAVVTLAGGAAVAVNATTGTDPVTLCSSAKNGAVTVPSSSGACAKGTTAFSVASDGAVQALEAQNAMQAQAIQDLQRRSDSLEGQISVTGQPGDPLAHYWTITARGDFLKPGAEVIWHGVFNGNPPFQRSVGTVDWEGRFVLVDDVSCAVTDVYYTTVSRYGEPVTSNTLTGSPPGGGC